MSFLSLYFVFYMNDKNLQYILRHRKKFYNITEEQICVLDDFFISIKNLIDFDSSFNDIRRCGCVSIIRLCDPYLRQKKEYEFLLKKNAFKNASWGQHESELAFKLLTTNKKIMSLVQQNDFRILTDDILDVFCNEFVHISKEEVKKNLVSKFFYGTQKEYDNFNKKLVLMIE